MTDGSVPQLVRPDWLEARLDDPDLRVLDCTVHLSFDPDTGARREESGRADWERGRVPGSGFADLLGDLSATDDPDYPFELPSADRFGAAMEALGVGDDSRVVLYDAAGNRWAARVWWLLRTFGFDRVGVLDGGWSRWTREDRPVSTAPAGSRSTVPVDSEATSPASVESTSASLTTTLRERRVATKADVRESIGREDRCLVDALRPEDYAGTGVVKYSRPGHIPSSVNVPAVGDAGVVDPADGTYLPRDELRRRFADAGVFDCERVITYCGGGIAASSVAFALELVGVDDVAVYDGSLSEWAADPALPMETE
ncbi:MAG: sulfurtransferase [Haloferacaceae archaeon]